jgi:eukaryotic-like serine/threonine-protein kinase
MGQFFSFLKTKSFFLHLTISLISVVLVLFILIKSLSSFTDHGEKIEVPDFIDKQIPELDAMVADKDMQYLIVDSIYDPSKKPGVVIKQDPPPASGVKHNRTVYLYVTSMVAPQMLMPKLVDRSERQARLLILSYGLKIGKIITKSSDCNGCVIAQMHKDVEIEAGAPIKKGSVIDLVVGVKDGAYVPADSLNGNNANNKPSFDEE